MPSAIYENFDLVITRKPDGTYSADARDTPGGDASVTFTFGGAPPEVLGVVTRNFQLTPAPAAPPPAAAGQPPGANGAPAIKDVGKYLYGAVFRDAMLAALRLGQERTHRRNTFLRIRLNLTDVPELAGLPWEMLSSESDNLALSVRTSVVRYQEREGAGAPEDLLVKEKPLRMLVVISNPDVPGAPALKVEEEWKRINDALQPLREQNLIELERLPRATLEELDNRAYDQARPVHIFHYIGHGDFDAAAGKGLLLFEGDAGGAKVNYVDGERLGISLSSFLSLRMAVLNSCKGATVSGADSFAGVAQKLLLGGDVPVVVAMRREISDDVAVAFAQVFFKWLLVNNLPVDAALTRARLTMRDVEYSRARAVAPSEWATPILFMRNHDGYLVDFQGRGRVPDITGLQPGGVPGVDPAAAEHYKTVLAALTKGKLVPFLGLDVNLFSREAVEDWLPESGTLPSYRELVKYLATSSKHPFPFIPALADVSQYALLHSDDEGTFYDTLADIFRRAGEPTGLHKFWARLAKQNDLLTGAAKANVDDETRRFLIVSCTYDNLLEAAFKQELDRFHVVSYVAYGENQGKFRHTVYAKPAPDAGEPVKQSQVVIDIANNYAGLYDQSPVILKIPGTVGEAAKPPFAITEDQYLDLLSKRELAGILPSQLLTKLRNSSHLFLGCNVREWSLRALLYRIWEDHQAHYASWAVLDRPGDIEKKYWGACKVRVIEQGLAEYLDGLGKSCLSLLPESQPLGGRA
ncbi:MAG: CHAT domain-containing protein [Acidobacteria bacterium]|nr:CHAT domain-containing protein [Acidobacteriota bacterium]